MTEKQADEYVLQNHKFENWKSVHQGSGFEISLKEFYDIFFSDTGAFRPEIFAKLNPDLTNISATQWNSNNQMTLNSRVANIILDVDSVSTYTLKSFTDKVLVVELVIKTVDNYYSDTF
jgi:hypothetical protein